MLESAERAAVMAYTDHSLPKLKDDGEVPVDSSAAFEHDPTRPPNPPETRVAQNDIRSSCMFTAHRKAT